MSKKVYYYYWRYQVHHNEKISFLAIVFSFLFSANVVFAGGLQTQETLEQRLSRLSEVSQKKVANETAEERVLRLRAEQIRVERELKKAREDMKRTASPEMRQAMGEAEKARKVEKEQLEALARAEISGCEPGTVWVNPDAVPHSSIGSTVRIRVFNSELVAVNIEDPRHGLAVRGLCAGGSITLFRARGILDPDFTQFRFIARAMLDGRMMLDESQSYTLSKYDWSSGGGRQEKDWTIQLRPVR
jgi:hypothetical protein